MRISVNFDAQPRLGAIEVGDVATEQNMLPSDVKS
jgi:hypothetical protein